MTDYKEEGLPILLSGSKRKFNIGHDGSNTPNKRKRTGSHNSKSAAPPRSSWESKKMKIDLIVAKSQILKLKARVDHLRTIHMEKQNMAETEIHRLKEQLANVQMREQELKEDYTETVKEYKQAKTQWYKMHNELNKKLAFVKDKLLEENVSSKVQLSEMKKDMDVLRQTAEKRLVNMAELEKEVVRLRATERSLRNGIADKLVLEEQVHQLSSRLAVLQPVQQELHEAKMKLASMESTLEEWQSAARARALSSELTATAASSQAHSQAAHPTEIQELKAAMPEGEPKVGSDESQELRQQLENTRIELKRMKEEFTSAQEYRDMVCRLLGYKMDRTDPKNYRLSNIYAESPDVYFTCTVGEEGINLTYTEYSATVGELVELHLRQHRSIPLFLSAITTDLFTRTTMQKIQD